MGADVRFYIGGPLAGWLAGWPQNPMRADERFYIDGSLAGWLADRGTPWARISCRIVIPS
jgi:hypothetical protein